MTNFESFSEDLVPRITPQPAIIPALNIAKPIVPEVSIIFDEKKLETEQPKSYKEWRDKQQRTQVVPVNLTEKNAIGTKNKFVKFDGVDQSGSEQPRQNIPTYSTMPLIDIDACRLNAIDSNEIKMNNGHMNGIDAKQCENRNQMLSAIRRDFQPTETMNSTPNETAISKSTITMEEMYRMMSLQQKRMETNTNRNVENVQPPQSSTATPAQKAITLDDIFQLLLHSQQTQQTQHQLEPSSQPVNIVPAPVQAMNQTLPIAKEIPMDLKRSEDSEPSLKDLFHIIVKQQEQLINIQKQVQAILVQNTNRMPQNDHNRPICDAYNQFNGAPNPMGVMTSLEINVQKFSHNKKSPPNRKLTPSSNDAANKENVLQCCSNCKSPLNQIAAEKINALNEIAAEQQQESPHSEQNNPNDWTFYGNILNQVNHVLQNSPPINADTNKAFHNEQMSRQPITPNDSSTPSSASSSSNCNVFVGPTPSHIRSAQFQQIGLKFDDVNVSATSKRVTFDTTTNGMQRAQLPTFDQSTTTDKSVIMNALAMKYLPIEQRQQSSPHHASLPITNQVTLTQTMTTAAGAAYNTAPNRLNQLNSPSDMSVASYRYMEKYGLL